VDQYLEQTQVHERVRREAFDALGLDQEADSPARQVGQSLVVGDCMGQSTLGTMAYGSSELPRKRL